MTNHNLQLLRKFRVLLRNTQTYQYFAGPTGWVATCDKAHEFDLVEDAIILARRQKLVGLEVVLRYDDSASDLILPIRQD